MISALLFPDADAVDGAEGAGPYRWSGDAHGAVVADCYLAEAPNPPAG